ncbi:MFS transporter [Micromonospora echinofusca]|uniref:MFS transporter n=1 Tax=Micromonospora echinofusca TaxID=47858 RepID=A0ABS3VLA5_MICEH|nr:MFS transporter [Micromonospora echinofusca]MBO4205251.1 MFS transporter [Micromonospora echinofusca]
MRPLGSVVERVVGDEIPGPLRPILTSILVNFTALGLFGIFFGPWLTTELHAPAGTAALAYVVAGIGGIVGGYLGGRASDRYGPRPVIAVGAAVQTAACLALLIPGLGVPAAAVLLVVVTSTQPVRGVAQRTALVRAAAADRREAAFAGYRLVVNLGALAGPLAGAALLQADWWALHLGLAVLFGCSLLLGLRVAPGRPEAGATTDRPGAGAALRDPRLWVVLFATTAAWTVMYTYELVLPIVLTQSYGISPATWGLLYGLGPAMVVLLQLRVTRWLAPVPSVFRLVAGVALMGGAFLVLLGTVDLPVLLVLIVLFMLGDLVWGPVSDDLAVAIAPPGRQGTYLGVVTASIWLGGALAPGIGLPVRERYGESVLWIGVAVLATVAGVSYATIGRRTRASQSSS